MKMMKFKSLIPCVLLVFAANANANANANVNANANAEELCITVPECHEAKTLKLSFIKLSEQSPFLGGYLDKHYTVDGLLLILGKQNNKYSYQFQAELLDYYFGDMALETLEDSIKSSTDKNLMIKALQKRLKSNIECVSPKFCQKAKIRNKIVKKLIDNLSN